MRKVAAIIVDPEGQAPELAATLERALAEVKADDAQHEIKRIVVPAWDDVFAPKHRDAPLLPPLPVLPLDAHLLTLHSSGTTAFPKPIDLALESWLITCRGRNWLQLSYGGLRTFLGAMPAYHALGVLLSSSATLASGSTLALSPLGQAWVSAVRGSNEYASLRLSSATAALARYYAQGDGPDQGAGRHCRARLPADLGAGRRRH